MPTNLKSRPIEGYITDNAGNILRNAQIVIKEDTPSGSNIIDTVQSDDDGYFISKPIKNGLYDIYESGVRVLRQYHSSQPTVLQCYYPGQNNIPVGLVQFSDFISGDTPSNNINDFRTYIQLEPENIDIALYGHQYPLWMINPQSDLAVNAHPFEKLVDIHPEISTSNQSRLTHSRFDVEFFAPLYSQNSFHRKIRWAGVPGLTFYKDSKIVLPLDYYSIVPNQYNGYVQVNPGYVWAQHNADPTLIKISLDIESTSLNFYNKIAMGDILEIEFFNAGGSGICPLRFWCIIYYKQPASTGGVPYVFGRMWNSSYASHADQGVIDLNSISSVAGNVSKINIYQGMFNGIQSITQSTGEYFTVSENLYAQNQYVRFNTSGQRITSPELYNYSRA